MEPAGKGDDMCPDQDAHKEGRLAPRPGRPARTGKGRGGAAGRLFPLLLALVAGPAAAFPFPDSKDAQYQEWRRRIRDALFIPAPDPAPEVQAHGRFSPEPGIVAEKISFGSRSGLRVPAIVYRPERAAGKAPGLIVVNGHGGDKYSWYSYYSGILYARAGAVVLTFDPLGEGERNSERKSGTRAHDRLLQPEEMGRRLGGQLVADVLQAISCLSERPDVDAPRIAAMGYSLGSFLVSLAGAIDTRLHACVLAGGGNLDGPGGYWDRSKPMCQSIPYRSLLFLGDRAAAVYALHTSRGPTLIVNGLEDTVVSIPTQREPFFRDLRDRTIRLHGSEDGIFETQLVPEAGHRPFFITKQVALWLERQLDFPNWDESSIRAMAETHVGEWAKAKGVDLDPLYSTEQREGGTQALGARVPGLSRNDLSVFSDGEWLRNKGRLVYESWVTMAQKALTGTGQVLWDMNRLDEIGGHKATILGAPRLIEDKGAHAVAFDGVDDGIILDTNPLAGARSFTVEVIFRPDPAGQKAQRFLHMEADEDHRVLVETRLNDSGEWFLDTFIKSGRSETTLQSKDRLHPLGSWYHAALTLDGNLMRHYVNGIEESSGAVEYAPVDGGRTSVGCRLNRIFWFKGAIRRIRITDRALSPDQFLK